MASVTLRNVRKAFGTVEVIHDLTLEVGNRDFLVLLGPSGCGKSTLLRIIAGLERVSAGSVLFNDAVVNELPPKRRNVAMVFQNYALYGHMTGFDNIAFSLRLQRLPKDRIRSAVMRAAEALNLVPYLHRYPRELSGGQRQRIAMGRAIVREPSVFLFDEPLSNLDANLRVQMRTEIKALHQRIQTTTIYVTHDQIEAMSLADKIVVMRDGRIEQIGAPLTIYDHPVNLFVARFLGSPPMNTIEGTVRQMNGVRVLATPDGGQVPLPDDTAGMEGAKVVCGVRPEDFGRAAPADGIETRVEVVEPTGPDVQVYGTIHGQPICATFTERLRVAPGERIYLRPQPGKIHLFDKTSGRHL